VVKYCLFYTRSTESRESEYFAVALSVRYEDNAANGSAIADVFSDWIINMIYEYTVNKTELLCFIGM